MEELVPKLREEGVEIIMFERVTDDVTPTVQKLKDLDARIIIAHFFFLIGTKFFCEVYRQGMYGEKYVYMLPGWAGGGFWRRDSFDSQYNCTANQLTAALENHFSMNYLSYTSDNTSVLGMTVKEFRDAMMERAGQSTEYSAFAFDAMFSIAQVLHMASTDRGLNLSDFSYDNTNFSSIFVEDLQQLKTSGISTECEYSRRADFLPLEASVPISVLAGAGLLVALTFLAANFRFRNLRYIKLSSPTMNNVVSLGCGLGYISVILYSLDGRLLSHHEFGIMCNLRLVVLCVAYSLAFGALFFKTWRVHRIMANKRLEKIVDPNDPDQYWLGAMLVYKGLLLLFGLFLAWETRKIQVEALNDSKYIGMCVYNMAVVCIVGVPVSFLINNDYYVGNYAISCLFIILGDTITLCFVFVPKLTANIAMQRRLEAMVTEVVLDAL
nr:hypothetical protein BaRGS_001516 [Batillaria attramentaria]